MHTIRRGRRPKHLRTIISLCADADLSELGWDLRVVDPEQEEEADRANAS